MNQIIKGEKKTGIQHRRDSIANIGKQYQELLHWGELYYCYYKYHKGLAYLRKMTGGNHLAFDTMERSRIYWNWWKNHWSLRESEAMQVIGMLDDIKNRVATYKALHNVEALTWENDYYGSIMESSYAGMIGILYDDLNQKETL